MNRRMSCQQIRLLISGYSRLRQPGRANAEADSPNFQTGNAIDVSATLQAIPNLSPTDSALLQQYLRTRYGLSG